jgi:TonB family protein
MRTWLLALALAVGAASASAADEGAELSRVAAVVIVDALPPAPSVAERLARIRERIQAALVYPPGARWRELSGVTRVRFEIDAAGQAQGIETAGSSGHWLLDRAALRAVREAAPLPHVWGRLEVPVHFDLDSGGTAP